MVDPNSGEIEDFDTDNGQESHSKGNRSVGQITIGYQPSLEQLALLSQEGFMSTDHLMEDTRRLTQVCSELLPCVQTCLVQAIKDNTLE